MKLAIFLRVLLFGTLITAVYFGYIKIVFLVMLSFGLIVEVGKIWINRKVIKSSELTMQMIKRMQAKRDAEQKEKDITIN
jgi:hypothetical protein